MVKFEGISTGLKGDTTDFVLPAKLDIKHAKFIAEKTEGRDERPTAELAGRVLPTIIINIQEVPAQGLAAFVAWCH